jgi:hypothetical protein
MEEENKVGKIHVNSEYFISSKIQNFLLLFSFYSVCKRCQHVVEGEFKFYGCEKFTLCPHCNSKNENKYFDVFTFYTFKFQVFITVFLILTYSAFALKLINETILNTLFFFLTYIIIDQLWIRIPNKILLFFMWIPIAYVHYDQSLISFLRFILTIGMTFYDVVRMKSKLFVSNEVK